ncbi:hypothetical protein [Algoriphagus formosus]|uniref:Class I SAM-dependent methyltransferase n=1 Tax=Algoriphagus formosus TaxID=2007308 RepID=A0A4V3AQM4_9BACT|nr:hypothetical protein [Algoriphagus aquimaris]TDK43327.1 hypothetical protein E1898_12000 [Algoriphagus aquimaris]
MSSNKLYKENFYSKRNAETQKSAITILSVLFSYYKPQSMVDFGCGVGTWLNAGNQLGVSELMGFEGDWLDKKHLVIKEDSFQHRNLTTQIRLLKKYDLAISLEVAEHIEEKFASLFIENLTQASDVILFSAAIPGQRGSGHVNEQWPDYWIAKFEEFDYSPFDIIRPAVWMDSQVKTWYKQNTFVFVKRSKLSELPSFKEIPNSGKSNWSIVHPDTFKRQIEISHPKFSSLSKLLKSIPSVSVREFKTFIKKVVKG